MPKRSFVICFTGVDGSGKTTHAKFLKKYLEEHGYSCKYVWGASRPFLSYFFFAFTRVLGYWKRSKKNAYTDPLEYTPKHLLAKFAKMWRFFLFIDYQLKALAKIRLHLLMGKVVICDRYFYDLFMELKISNVLSERFCLLVSRSMPKPLVTFLMIASETLASSRRNFPPEFFLKRNGAFIEMAKTHGFIVIDSSTDMLENQRKIRQYTLARTQKLENRL